MATLSNLYLFAYNSFQALGWAVSVYKLSSGFIATASFASAYISAGNLICLLQAAAFLEVIHGSIGIVASGVVLPLMQWGGRTHFVFSIVTQINEIQELSWVFITFVAWSLSEIIRYPHHALNCIGSYPYWITYLRYTAFIVLYPLGFFGEMWIMYKALPYIKEKNLYGDFFAKLPFTYYDFVTALLVVYPFPWLKLYLHLFKQRRSKLANKFNSNKKKN